MAKAAAVASERLGGGEGDPRFLKAKLQSSRFFADHVLPQTAGLLASVVNSASVTTFGPALL